jgi:hypothetical protein
MTRDEAKTIFSIYQMWLNGKKEEPEAELRQVPDADQIKRKVREKPPQSDAYGQAYNLQGFGFYENAFLA